MLLWCDGFDHYGSSIANLLDGPYATAQNIALSTTHPGAGTHGIYINASSPVDSGGGLRKVLPAAKQKLGVAGRFYFAQLPEGNTSAAIFDFVSDSSLRSQVTCYVDSNGCLRFNRGTNYFTSGDSGTLIAQSDPIIVASANNHIEVQIYRHDTLGWIRAAINGVHRFQVENIDTSYNATDIVSVRQTMPFYGSTGGVSDGSFWMDDYYIYDFTGNSAVDTDFCPTVDGAGIATSYIGDLQAMYLPPNADTAEADWGMSTGSSGFALVDEVDPNDTDFIYSGTVNDLTEFSMTDLPPEITYIRGLQLIGRLSKADAGEARTRFGVKSVAAITDAPERPVTVEPTYWWDFINVDPNSSARWTRNSLNAAWFRLTRSL